MVTAALDAVQDGLIEDHIPPGLQRLLGRLGDTPAAVFTADWQLLWWNDGWSALFGDPSKLAREDRSYVHTRFPVPGHQGACLAGWPVESTDPDGIDRAVVADLRRAAGRYLADQRMGSLIQRTIDGNATFGRLWSEGAVGAHREEHKTIRHPHAGDITVTCDVLNDGDTDLKVVAYTTTPGSEDEARLAFTRVVGSAAGL